MQFKRIGVYSYNLLNLFQNYLTYSFRVRPLQYIVKITATAL